MHLNNPISQKSRTLTPPVRRQRPDLFRFVFFSRNKSPPFGKQILAHAILYSQKPGEHRAFLRHILGLAHLDAGDGWLIFSLPPAEASRAYTSPPRPTAGSLARKELSGISL